MSNTTPVNILNVETVRWMQKVTDHLTEKDYYMIGHVTNLEHTLAVTQVGSRGETMFFCTEHQCAYKITDECPDCVSQVVEADKS